MQQGTLAQPGLGFYGNPTLGTALAPLDNPDLAPRFARKSDDYVAEIVAAQAVIEEKTGSAEVAPEVKRAHLKMILSDRQNYMRRLGQGMIGPIQLKLRYQGMVRNVLMEDVLTPGIPVEYEILDDLGQAYILHGNEGEVKVTPFEGKKAPIKLFRIATFPQIKKEDLWFLRVNIVEYVQDESKQAIMKQEDARLLTVLDAAITDYGNSANHTYSPGAHVINELSGYLTPDTFYDLVALIDVHELRSARILMNPVDYRDLFKWDANQTGMGFKDAVVAGQSIESFGEFQIQRSIMVPQGTIYITPAPDFLGVMPIYYSLDVEENHTPEKFHKGWVMDEVVSFIVLNPRGLGKIVKS
jgi:hypothetical protein